MRKLVASFIALITILSFGFTSGKKVNASDNDVEGFVRRLYSVCLGREADSEGLQNWTNDLEGKKATGCSVAYGFIFSQEFQNKKCTNEEYVTYMYNAFFGRMPDEGGLNTWVGLLNSGASRESVFCGFANSLEFATLCNSYGIIRGYHVEGTDFIKNGQVNLFVYRLYTEILGRPCDEAGMQDWTISLVNHTMSGSEVAFGFVFSPEFVNKNLCNSHYIDVLYRAFLGREADISGKSTWINALESGSTREEIFNGFAGSKEFSNICNSYGIVSGSVNSTSKTYGNGKCSICGANTYNGKNKKNGFFMEGEDERLYYYIDDVIQDYKGWKEIDGKKYYFFKSVYMPHSYALNTNKAFINDTYYCFNQDGTLHTGWCKLSDGNFYYADEEGKIVFGWQDIDGNTYYFNSDAIRVKEWCFVEGRWLYFGDDGIYRPNTSGWVKTNKIGTVFYGSATFYVNEYGIPLTGWQKIEGDWYYFDKSDSSTNGMLHTGTGWQKIEGKLWYFNDKHQLVIYTGWQKINDKWYYFDDGGYMKTGWVLYKDVWYFLDDNGVMQTGFITDKHKIYYMNSDGSLYGKSKWLKLDDVWYYCQSDGSLAIGVVKVGNHTYVFDSKGQMQVGLIYVNISYIKDSEVVNREAGNLITNKDGIVIYPAEGSSQVTVDGVVYTYYDDGFIHSFMYNEGQGVKKPEEISCYITKYLD